MSRSRLPVEPAELANGRSTIFPQQLSGRGMASKLPNGIGAPAQMIRAVEARAGKKRFRRQESPFRGAWPFVPAWPLRPSHKE